MAEIKDPISAELLKSPGKYATELLKVVTALNKLITTGEGLIALNSKVATSDDTATTKKKKLTAAEVEANRINKAQLTAIAKLAKARSAEVIELTKTQVELKKANAAVLEGITGTKAAAKASKLSKQAIAAKTKILKAEQSAVASLEKQRSIALAGILKEEQETKKLSLILNQLSKGSYQSISKALSKNLKDWKLLTAAERDNTTKGKKLTATINSQRDALTKLDAKTGTATRGVGKYSQGITTAATSLMGAFGLVGGVAAFAKVLTSSIKTVVQFSKANSVLASVLGKTKKEIIELTNDSLAYGKSTQFTAVQVAQLQTELAKLGFKEDEIKNSTQAVLDFALATDAQLAPAAKVAGSTLRAMGLDASEMGRVTSALAVATTKSALSFEDYEGNLSTILPVSKKFGFSLEDTVALLGKLKDAGFDASSAATATRKIFLNMADANGALAQTMGGSVGSFDEMIDALVKMNKEGFDLGETLELTDVKSVSAFSTFLESAESARTLRNGITDVNDALKVMVDTRTDNAASSMIRMGSAWDGVVLSFSESEGFIKNFLDEITDILNSITDTTNAVDVGASKAIGSSVKFWKENSEGAEDYLSNLEMARKAQSGLTIDALNDFTDDPTSATRRFWETQVEIGKRLGVEVEKARTEAVADGLAERFDIENKSLEDLKKLQRSFSSFTTGEMKAQGDLILPLIEEQIKDREALELAARQKRARLDRQSAAERSKNAKIAADVDAQIEADLQKEIQEENEDTAEFLEQLQDYNAKVVDDGLKDITSAEKKAAAERKKIADKLANDKLATEKMVKDATIDLTAQGAQAITDLLLEASSQRRDEELDAIEEKRDEDLERIDEQTEEDLAKEDAKVEAETQTEEEATERKNRIQAAADLKSAKIEEEADARSAAIQTKQAKAEKAASIASVAINTAVSIIKAFAQLGPIGGAAITPFLIGAGAIQTAAILATPIPKFFKGIDSAPSGIISTAEKGQELVIPKGGNPFLTPDTQTFYSDLQGAEIVPNHKVKERLADMGAKGQSFNFSDAAIVSELRKNTKAVKRQGRSNTIDSVTTTKIGNRLIKKHNSLLANMRK